MGNRADAPFGFIPWGPVLRQRMYAVTTAPTVNFFHGDLVQHGGASLITKSGTRVIVEDGDIVATGDFVLGAIMSVMDENMDPMTYMAKLRTGDSTVAGYLMVADHPDQEYVVQEDCDTTPIPLASSEMNCDLYVPALNLGDTGTGRSKAELDSNTAADTVTLTCKLNHPHPDDTVPGTDGTNHPRWIVTINAAHFGDNLLGKVTTS